MALIETTKKLAPPCKINITCKAAIDFYATEKREALS